MVEDSTSLRLFQGIGIELEYMIVDSGTLSVLPIADKVLQAVAGELVSDVDVGEISWSNELVLHVIELKTNGPARSVDGLAAPFSAGVARINEILRPMGGRLMPTAMHPWMNPAREMKLWPHDYSPVYEAFDRIFSCRGHGWSNLQSVHINLPFEGDEELGRLHAAIRLLLPIMPALAASSPIVEGRVTGLADNRLDMYRNNARLVPSVAGKVIPEPVFTRHDYESQILDQIYRDMAPHDPEGVLRYEWANARGAIARFNRNTIEIRVLDIQECPQADLAIAAAIVAVLQALVAERWTNLRFQQGWQVDPLAGILLDTIHKGDQAVISDRMYLETFGYQPPEPCTAGQLWRHLIEATMPASSAVPEHLESLHIILDQGCLARRIMADLGEDASASRMAAIYERLCECLADGSMFVVED